MLTDAGAPVEQVGAIVMETTSAFTVVPARQVDTAGVVVALNQALCTLVNIWGHEHTQQHHCQSKHFPGNKREPETSAHFVSFDVLPVLWSALCSSGGSANQNKTTAATAELGQRMPTLDSQTHLQLVCRSRDQSLLEITPFGCRVVSSCALFFPLSISSPCSLTLCLWCAACIQRLSPEVLGLCTFLGEYISLIHYLWCEHCSVKINNLNIFPSPAIIYSWLKEVHTMWQVRWFTSTWQ